MIINYKSYTMLSSLLHRSANSIAKSTATQHRLFSSYYNKVAFVGAGKMAEALIQPLVENKVRFDMDLFCKVNDIFFLNIYSYLLKVAYFIG